MIIFKHSYDLKDHLQKIKKNHKSVGFVPTMGALHNGHLSLIKKCKRKADVSVCSIFINPTQFNNPEDFKKYPSNIERDILLLIENDCDILFLPSETEMYPDEDSKIMHFDLGHLEKIMEGKYRPGHFQGVCLIVEKLLKIINADFLFLGQKDYQQCLVIKKLIQLMHMNIKVIICPIRRELNGLAMSSRNQRLRNNEKEKASLLYKTLMFIKKNIHKKNLLQLKDNAIAKLRENGFNVDYLEIANRKNLRTVRKEKLPEKGIILVAAYINNVRLIDNVLIKSEY